MQILDQILTLEVLCKATNKWGMLIGWCDDRPSSFEEVQKAAPYLKFPEHGQVMIESGAYLLFDTEEEMGRHYDLTVGDDGPTPDNPYNGPLRVYAITCDPNGQLLNENT